VARPRSGQTPGRQKRKWFWGKEFCPPADFGGVPTTPRTASPFSRIRLREAPPKRQAKKTKV